MKRVFIKSYDNNYINIEHIKKFSVINHKQHDGVHLAICAYDKDNSKYILEISDKAYKKRMFSNKVTSENIEKYNEEKKEVLEQLDNFIKNLI